MTVLIAGLIQDCFERLPQLFAKSVIGEYYLHVGGANDAKLQRPLVP